MSHNQRVAFLWTHLADIKNNFHIAIALSNANRPILIKALYACGAYFLLKTLLKSSAWACRFIKHHILYRVRNYRNPAKLKEKFFGDWAVITGCTSGIGKAFTTELAKHGFNLILISRSEPKLKHLANILEGQYRISTVEVPVDFSQATRDTYDQISEVLSAKNTGILVNNVGIHYDHPEYYKDIPQKRVFDLISVNVTAASVLTHMVLPAMERRGGGAIINMSSSAGLNPNPLISQYSATKAYLDSLSSALHFECGTESRVAIFTLIPFYVCTNMTQYSDALSRPSVLVPSAESYVSDHVMPIICQSPGGLHTTGYWAHTLQLALCSCIPRYLWCKASLLLHKYMRQIAISKHEH